MKCAPLSPPFGFASDACTGGCREVHFTFLMMLLPGSAKCNPLQPGLSDCRLHCFWRERAIRIGVSECTCFLLIVLYSCPHCLPVLQLMQPMTPCAHPSVHHSCIPPDRVLCIGKGVLQGTGRQLPMKAYEVNSRRSPPTLP